MDTKYSRTCEARREEIKQVSGIKAKETKITFAAYDALNDATSSFGESINLGTLSTIAALGYADWSHPEDDWRTGRAALANWFKWISARPSVKLTAPIFQPTHKMLPSHLMSEISKSYRFKF